MAAPFKFISVEPNEDQLLRLQRTLAAYPKGYKKIVSRSINKIATKARKLVVDRVKQDINIPVGEMKRRNIRLKKANFSRLSSMIQISGGRIPLIRFNASQKQTWPGTKYKIGKTGPRQLVRHAFIAVMKSGHRGVFKRTRGNNSTPITELRGPSVPQVFHDVREFAAGLLDRTIAVRLQQELETQLNVFMEQAG
jgi:hypothetical protein